MSQRLDRDLDVIEAAMSRFVRQYKSHRLWEAIIARADCTIDRPSAAILQIMDRYPGQRLRLQDLVQHLGIEAPPVSRKVSELESAGLVERQTDPADRRAQTFALNRRGKELARHIQAARRSILRETLKEWPTEERQQLARLLDQLANDLPNLTK